ncbi:MAG: dienelactone hydrolase family protein [Bacteroidia bacterium]|nr:dienelactone hydrolase family protein [Bacteroidia bacterium]
MSNPQLSLFHLYKPAESQTGKQPAIFLFHGYGSDEEDLFSFASELPSKLAVISVRAPRPMNPFGNAWYTLNFEAPQGKWSDVEEAIESREMIFSFIDEAIETYKLDPENINLLGFSQGAVLSYAIALSRPEKIKNLMALSGYIDLKVVEEGFENKPIKNLNIYISHGQVDQVIPAEWAQASSETLKSLGVEHTYEEYPVGHGVSPQNFYSLKAWLEQHI